MITTEELNSTLRKIDPTENDYKALRLLLVAINDWPIKDLIGTKELLSQIRIDIKSKLTKTHLQLYSITLLLNQEKKGNVHKAKALTSLLKLFEFYPNAKTINDILNELTERSKS